MDFLFIIALALVFGVLFARIFKKLKIPQVVAFVILGVILGAAGFKIINADLLQEFSPINSFALGIIGFLIGSELKKEVFQKFGKKLITILLFESIGAFVLVLFLTALFTKGNWALSILLGALASATAPAATVDVLWEYKSAGPLTTMVFAIVALDDGIALLLYGFANSSAHVLLNHQGFSWATAVFKPLYEIFGSAVLGILAALLLKLILKYLSQKVKEKGLLLSLTIGIILLIISVSAPLHLDLILGAMFFGITFANIAKKSEQSAFQEIQDFSPPIYILFFILVGARLQFLHIKSWIWILALIYIIARTIGKIAGASIGAWIAKAPTSVRKYLGFCLFSQAGVSIGLALLTAQNFSNHPEIGISVLSIITSTTFIVQIIGPPFVKFAITKSNEAFQNITIEDLLEKYKVKDIIERKKTTLQEDDNLQTIFKKVAQSSSIYFPVLNKKNQIKGLVTAMGLEKVLGMHELSTFLLASDLMEPLEWFTYDDTSLMEARNIMVDNNLNYLPVLSKDDNTQYIGVLELREIRKKLGEEIIRRKKLMEA